MKVSVTEQDIKEGEKGNCWHCPVALALKRATGREVSVRALNWGFKDGAGFYDLPQSARLFINEFDRWGKEEPFSFEVDIDPS